jgi:hypothetical protein
MAMMSICRVLRPSNIRKEGPAAPWTQEIEARCPTQTPIPDPNEELAMSAYWKQWWASNRDRLTEQYHLASVRVPARYQSAPMAADPEVVEVGMEERMSILAIMNRARAQTAAEGRAPASNEFFGFTLNEGDAAICRTVLDRINAATEQQQSEIRRLRNKARVAGRPIDPAAMQQDIQARQRLLSEGLDQLRRELSGEGWRAVEAFLQSMNVTGGRMTPPPRKQ